MQIYFLTMVTRSSTSQYCSIESYRIFTPAERGFTLPILPPVLITCRSADEAEMGTLLTNSNI